MTERNSNTNIQQTQMEMEHVVETGLGQIGVKIKIQIDKEADIIGKILEAYPEVDYQPITMLANLLEGKQGLEDYRK